MDALRVKMIANTDANHVHHHVAMNVVLVVPEVVMYYPTCQMIELVKIVVPQQHVRLTAR
jgi:chromosome condensin MukBEF complex kleisin-like MukF subunit